MSITDKLKEDLIPALISGGIALGIHKFVLGEDLGYDLNLFGMNVPVSIAIGGVQFGSHLLGNVLENQVIGYIDPSRTGTTVALLAKPMISGGASLALYRFGLGDTDMQISHLVNQFAIGVTATIGGDYGYKIIMGQKN